MSAALKRLFNELPFLDFSISGGDIDYIHPPLRKPAYRGRRLRDRAESPAQHAALSAIFRYLLLGTGKLEYGRTSDADWLRYMRFPTDRMPALPNGRYSRLDAPSTSSDIINWDAETAKTWLLDTLIPKIQNETRSQVYVVGDPGSGKSTLIKYLLNTNHDVIRNEWVIFTRFEYLKFQSSWWDRRNLQRSLDEYLSYIMLRDALYFYGYERSKTRQTRRMTGGRLTEDQIAQLMFHVAVDLNPTPQVANSWYTDIRDCMRLEEVDLDRLRNIPHEVRASFLSHLDDASHEAMPSAYKTTFCVIMDGLDYISIDDFAFNNAQHEILRYIMSRRADLTNFRLSKDRAKFIRSVPMFVMRSNTYDHFNKDRQIDVASVSIFQVAPIDPEVTIHNAICRATNLMVAAGDLDPLQRDAMVHRLFRSVAFVMMSINKRAKIGKGRRAVYGLFGNNLRTQMEFIHKIFIILIDDAIASDSLKLINIKAPIEILSVIDSEVGRRIIKRRRYRLIELLLFSYIPWFETAIIYRTEDDDEGDDDGVDRWGRDNPLFTGVVDNIFNYTTTRHPNDPDQHCFLEKVRIVQSIMVAEGGDAAPTPRLVGRALAKWKDQPSGTSSERYFPKKSQILRKMRELSGYVPRDIDHSLYMLMRTEMIVAHVGADGRRGYAVTPMGRAVVGALCRDMSYVEHIFHGTLFPRPLVEGLEDEYREKSVDTWTVTSIRNAFIWLTYLRFVEDNDANGVSALPGIRLLDDTRKRVLQSIDRILDPNRREDVRLNQARVAEQAIGEVKRVIALWNRRGVIRNVSI